MSAHPVARLVLRRLAALPLILLAVAALTFALAQLSPYSPVDSGGFDSRVSTETREQIERVWGLDKPVVEQFGYWLSRVVRGDFGHSRLLGGQPVIEELAQRALPSVVLVLAALLIVLVGGLVAGVLAAAFRDTWFDWSIRSLCYLNTAAPSFWVGLLMLWLFAVQLGWLPAGGTTDVRSPDAPLIDVRYLILPALTLAATQYAWFTLYVRTGLLEVQREDYVRFAEAGGLRRARVLFRHALPNALLTFITLIGTHLSELIGGAVLAEVIFGWPGLGQLTVEAARALDLPLLVAITLAGSVVVVLGNLVADLLYRVADPRIRAAG